MSSIWWIWSSFFFLEGVVAIYLHLYIVFFHGRSLTEGGRRNPISLIHIIMGINKITMQCTWTVNLAYWLKDMYDPLFFSITDCLLAFHIYFGFWLTAWLCFCYSIFIANFSHRMFVWIKRDLLAFLPQMLLITGVGSLATALLAYKASSSTQYSTNGTTIEDVFYTSCYKISAISLGYCLPFTVIAISLLVALSSLHKHVNNISQTGINVEAHDTLLKSMTIYLIFSASSFFCYIVDVTSIYKSTKPLHYIIWLLMLMAPTIETIIIIQAIPELKKNFPSWFCARGFSNSFR